MKNIFSCFLLVFILCKCEFKEKESFNNDINSLYAVIEIPAGTNIKYEYNYDSQSFDVDVVNGQKRIINYLPYPGNYGFIENDMNSRNSTSKKQPDSDQTKTRKKREELSVSACKCIKKENVKIIVKFD